MIAALVAAWLLHLSPAFAGERSDSKPRRAVSNPGEGVAWGSSKHRATFVLHLQPDGVAATVSVQPEKIDLGETATLTLAIEGVAPLRVEMPAEAEKLLSPKSALMWQIKPLGPAKTVAQAGGRERWEQSFRMSPFFHGDRVLLAFNSIPVNGQPLTFEAQGVRVRKTIELANAEKAVPVTGIETLPAIPPTPPDASGWPYVAGLAVVFAAAIAFVLLRRKKAAPPPVPPNEWAERELDRLERDHAMERIDARAATERLAAILREYAERRFSVAAPRLTTAELHAAAVAAEWPADRADPLRDLLELCDRAKFAGESPNGAGVLALIGAARAWIEAGRPNESEISRS